MLSLGGCLSRRRKSVDAKNQRQLLAAMETKADENGNGAAEEASSGSPPADLVDDIPDSPSSSDPSPSLEDLPNLPDPAVLLEKLAGIRDSKTQVIGLLDQLKETAPNPEDIDKEKLVKLVAAYDGFKAQEEQYLALLEKVMVLKEAYSRTQAGLSELEEAGGASAEKGGGAAAPDLRIATGLLSGLKAKREREAGRVMSESLPASPARAAAAPAVPSPAHSASAGPEDPEEGLDELEALKKQRDLLRKMVESQRAMRDQQAKKAAAEMNQRDSLQGQLEQETMDVRSLVAEQAASIESKKAELAELKAKLAATKNITGDVVAECADTDARHLLAPIANGEDEDEDETAARAALQALGEKRVQLASLLGNLGSLEAAIDNAQPLPPGLQIREVEEEPRPRREDSAPIANGNDVDEDDEPTEQDKEALDDALTGLNEQMRELADARERLQQLQELAAEVTADGRALPDDIKEAIELVLDGMEQTMGGMEGSEEAPAVERAPSPLPDVDSSHLRHLDMDELKAAFNHNLAEQEDAMDTLKREQIRVAGVKARIAEIQANELSGPSNPPVQRSLEPRDLPHHRLSPRPAPEVVKSASARLADRAAFIPHPSHSSRSSQPSPKPDAGWEARSTHSSASQYEQLEAHMEGIRSIFASGMSPGPAIPSAMTTSDPGPAWAAALQTQQLMLAQMMTTQQQLAAQQAEVARLTAAFQDLSARTATPLASPLPTVGPGHAPPASAPQPYDGRPLSTGSLYNLLAPNPYLPFHLYNPSLLQAPVNNVLQPSLEKAAEAAKTSSRPPAAPGARHPWAPNAPELNASYPGPRRHESPASRLTASFAAGPSHRPFESSDSQPEPIPEAEEGGPTARPAPAVPKLDLRGRSHSSSRPPTVSSRQEGNPGGVSESQEYLAQAVRSISNASSRYNSPRRVPHARSSEEFDELRENIYSEVAALISANEERPAYLLDLFRELQLVRSDDSRHRTLTALQESLGRWDPPRSSLYKDAGNPFLSTTTFDITTDDAPTSDDEGDQSTPKKSTARTIPASARAAHDYSEAVTTSSSLSTPTEATAVEETAEARRARTRLEIGELEKAVGALVQSLVPKLKKEAAMTADQPLFNHIRDAVLSGLMQGEVAAAGVWASDPALRDQLGGLLDNALSKYTGEAVGAVSADMLSDVSEVVFNELAFARLLRNVDAALKAAPLPTEKGTTETTEDASPKTEELSESLQAFKAPTPRLPPLLSSGEEKKAAVLDSEIEAVIGAAANNNAVATNGHSEEHIAEEIEASSVKSSPSTEVKVDLSVEPHPEDHVNANA